MAFNVLDLAKDYLTNAAVEKLAGVVGGNSSTVQTGLTAALPALLGGIINKGSSESGLSTIMNLVTNNSNTDLLSNIMGVLGDSNQSSSLMNVGGSILSSVLGNNQNSVTDSISSFAGLPKGAAGSLLKFAAPLIISIISKKVKSDGLGLSGLGSLLSSQKSHVDAAMPSGLSSILNFAGNKTEKAADRVVETYEEEKPGGNKWLPYLIAGLLLLGALFAWRSCKDDAVAVVEDTATAVGDVATDAASAVGDGVSALGDFFSRKLPNGLELNIPKLGIENRLIDFIEGSDAISKEAWLNFDRINFATGSANLTEESAEQVKNISDILAAYPKVNMKIGGYTDNTGSADGNMKLSAARATTVMNAIVANGIDAGRLTSEGYGDAHPVASNDTEEGRAQNRRISVNVTAK